MSEPIHTNTTHTDACSSWTDSGFCDCIHFTSPADVAAVMERDRLRAQVTEARDLLQRWQEGFEPALATSRWLTKNGGAR